MIRKLAARLPGAKQLSELLKSPELVKKQEGVIAEQADRIGRLEARNDEWAAEVRELRHQDERYNIIWPVSVQDLIDANPLAAKTIPRRPKKKANPEKLRIAWVIPPIGETSGGHTTILRLVSYLEQRGHECTIYIYDPQSTSTLAINKKNLKHYPGVNATIHYNDKLEDAYDIMFATSWHTAYPLYNADISAKKCYFVQDFEPFFDAVGTYSTLAENTYKFGFYGIAMGHWLAEKLTKDYGMKASGFDLGITSGEYYQKPEGVKRNKVVFYARPVTPRRGFELGVLALEIFHKAHPEYEIHFVGWDTSRYNIPFEYVNHGILSIKELNDLYNECAAGLVLSFTNISLLPLELYASGCVPVMNKAYHTTTVGYCDFMEYAEPYPAELAKALERAVKKQTSSAGLKKIDELVKENSWEKVFSRIEKTLKRLF